MFIYQQVCITQVFWAEVPALIIIICFKNEKGKQIHTKSARI